jgi:hypothetical protein
MSQGISENGAVSSVPLGIYYQILFCHHRQEHDNS